MLLDVVPEQEVLRAASARLVDSECPLTRVRALIDDAEGVDRRYLEQAAQLGWFAGFVPEEHGGGSVSGTPALDAVLVGELRGRSVQPGPYAAANAVAHAVAEWGSDELRRTCLPLMATGEMVGALALADARGSWNPGAGVVARKGPGGYVLSGVKRAVQDAHLADVFLVSAAVSDGVIAVVMDRDVAGLGVTRQAGVDLTRRLGELRLDDVEVPHSAVLGGPEGGREPVERAFDLAALLTMAESVGTMDRLFETTVDYAKIRVAFGRPIGSYQAIKHLLADLRLLLEACKAATTAAATAVQHRRPDAAETLSMAKAYVGESGIEISQGCLQVHGGIGYTWEHDLHLYLRRLAGDCALYGDPAWHRERLWKLYDL